MASSPIASTPVRRRTQQAIVDAAIAVWVRDRDATLVDVARAAQTHRATLHRHFANRAELLDAAVRQCVAAIVQATEAAAVAEGTPIEAIRRVIVGYLSIGDRIRFLFDDLALTRHPAMTELTASEGPVLELIRRGQHDGTLDASLPPEWIERSIWALVYTASEAIDDGLLSAHDARTTLLRTVEHGITRAGD